MSKQDRVASRTAEDVERKYNFGKTFAEVFGLAEDARNAAETAQNAADNAVEAVGSLDQDAIFNLLTNSGELKGLFMKDGQLYINASYLVTGVIKSENGKLVIDLSGVTEPTFNTGISTNGLTIRADEANAQKLVKIFAGKGTQYDGYVGYGEFYSTNGTKLINLTEGFNSDFSEPVGVSLEIYNQPHTRSVKIDSSTEQAGVWVTKDNVVVGYLVAANDGSSMLRTDKINNKTVSWKDNGDGTFTLIGQ